MADEDDFIFVLLIKKKEEDTEKVRREEEKQEDPEKMKRKVKREEGKEEDLKEKENEEAAATLHELPEIEKLNIVQATTTATAAMKRNVNILKIIREEAFKAKKRVEILMFNQVKEAVENQIEYPRKISFMVVEQIFSREIHRVLKLPELRFIPCIIFSHTPVLVRRYMWNDGKTRSKECSADIIREFMKGILSERFATMRREAAKLDDALSTTEKTSSEEEEEEEEQPDDGEGQRGRRRVF